MLFRYSIPVARHGELLSVTHYVNSERNPTKKQLLTLFEEKLEKARNKAINVNSEASWREVKNLEGCIYAIEHIKHPDLPRLPTNGMNDIPVFCETELGHSSLRVTLIVPDEIPQEPTLRLVVGG